MDRNLLIEIQKFWGVEEYGCKKCGCVLPVDDIQPIYNENNKGYKIDCLDCGAYICYIKQAKVHRMFKNEKEGLVDVEKIERGWLRWAVSVNHSAFKNKGLLAAVNRRINSEDSIPVADWKTTKPEQDKIDKIHELRYLEKEVQRLFVERRRLFIDTAHLDYYEMEQLKKVGNVMKKDQETAERRVTRLIEYLKDV